MDRIDVREKVLSAFESLGGKWYHYTKEFDDPKLNYEYDACIIKHSWPLSESSRIAPTVNFDIIFNPNTVTFIGQYMSKELETLQIQETNHNFQYGPINILLMHIIDKFYDFQYDYKFTESFWDSKNDEMYKVEEI